MQQFPCSSWCSPQDQKASRFPSSASIHRRHPDAFVYIIEVGSVMALHMYGLRVVPSRGCVEQLVSHFVDARAWYD